MITAVDTSVLLDVFAADPVFGLRSQQASRGALVDGSLTACEVVWAEVGGFFPSAGGVRVAMETLGVDYDSTALESALAASAAWKRYRERGGRRVRLVADFLIGAHAAAQADRLLTRDRGFYRTYFSQLRLLDPTK